MKLREIRLNVESSLENVALLGASVRAVCEQALPAGEDPSLMELCVVEAVNNVIQHSFASEGGHIIEVVVAFYEDRVVFRLSNDGSPWDSGKCTAFEFEPRAREVLPEGGMGLHIINSVMDEVNCENDRGRNILTMSRRYGKGRAS